MKTSNKLLSGLGVLILGALIVVNVMVTNEVKKTPINPELQKLNKNDSVNINLKL